LQSAGFLMAGFSDPGDCQMASNGDRRAAIFLSAVLLWAGPAPAEEAAGTSDPMLADAQLADVTFVDRAHGWAVGDRGVIWHTSDGGRSWALQRSGVDCRLSSVFFLDRRCGWAAGGYMQPYTQLSVGVVLATSDGGEHWAPKSARILPAVERIGFFNRQQG